MSRRQHANAAFACALIGCLFLLVSSTGCATNTSVEEAVGGGPPPEGQAPPAETLRFTAWSGGDTQVDLYDFRQALTDMGVYQRWGVDEDQGLNRVEFADGVFEVWDTDNDDLVSRAEWQAAKDQWYIKGLDAGSFEDWTRDDNAGIEALEFASALDGTRLYWSWDDNKDGTIDRREFAEEVFRLWDTSDNGAIEKDEWEQALDQWVEPQQLVRRSGIQTNSM